VKNTTATHYINIISVKLQNESQLKAAQFKTLKNGPIDKILNELN